MYRSWAYILMVMATLVGVVALLWPSPQVRTISEIASVPREEPRVEAPPKPPKPAIKPPQPKTPPKPAAAPAAPAVVRKMPAPNTTTRRAAPVLQNGLEPNMFGKPAGQAPDLVPPPAPPRPGGLTARPVPPPPPPPPDAATDPSLNP